MEVLSSSRDVNGWALGASQGQDLWGHGKEHATERIFGLKVLENI